MFTEKTPCKSINRKEISSYSSLLSPNKVLLLDITQTLVLHIISGYSTNYVAIIIVKTVMIAW